MSRPTLLHPRPRKFVSAISTLTATSSARTRASIRASDSTTAAAELSSVSVQRRDGRALEEALLLELL